MRISKTKAIKSLVKVSNDEFAFLDRNSIIECNHTEHLDIQGLVHRVEESKGFRIKSDKIPTYLKKEIVSAINNSPLVRPFIQKAAIKANPI